MESKYDKYRERYASSNDEALIAIALDDEETYEDEAILAARYVLEKRGIDYRNVDPEQLGDHEGAPVYVKEISEYVRAYKMIRELKFEPIKEVLINDFELDEEFMDSFEEHFKVFKNGEWENEEEEKGILVISSLANEQENQTDFELYLMGLDWNSDRKAYLEGLDSGFWPYLLMYRKDLKKIGAEKIAAALLWQYNFALQAELFEFDDSADGMLYHDSDWDFN